MKSHSKSKSKSRINLSSSDIAIDLELSTANKKQSLPKYDNGVDKEQGEGLSEEIEVEVE